MKGRACGLLDGNNLLGSDTQISEEHWVEAVDAWEVDALIPEEFDYSELTGDADNVPSRCRYQ